MPEIMELLAIAALVITIFAGLLQIADWFAKKNKKSDE